MDNTVFGFAEAQITGIWPDLWRGRADAVDDFYCGQFSWKCKAGKTGTFILF